MGRRRQRKNMKYETKRIKNCLEMQNSSLNKVAATPAPLHPPEASSTPTPRDNDPDLQSDNYLGFVPPPMTFDRLLEESLRVKYKVKQKVIDR